MVVFLFSFVSSYFLISSLISSVISWLFSNVLFSLHVFVFYMILVKGGRAVKRAFWQRLAASHTEQMSPLMILVIF